MNAIPRLSDPSELEELLQFLYLMPIGVVKFAPDGQVELMNPMASQLLTPLLRDPPRLDNVFVALEHLVPELRERIRAHGDTPGTILEARHIEGLRGTERLILALTATRINERCCMAVIKDVSRLTEMLGFAFTAADLLIDVDAAGRITWAAGATERLIGRKPQETVGRPLAEIVAPRDRDRLQRALATIGTRGRIRPVTLRLDNAAETPAVVGGMAPGGAGSRIYITMGPPATPLPASELGAAAVAGGGRDFAREVEAWARDGQAGALGLIEVPDWAATAGGLDTRMLGCLRREIGQLAQDVAGASVLIGEIGEGRFGVLGPAAIDVGQLGSAMDELLAGFLPGRAAQVQASRVGLGGDGLDPIQSVQSLRLLLARFAARGVSGVPEGGLAGMLEAAKSHRKVLAEVIARGRFTLHYQPVVSLDGRAIHHHEALVRPGAEVGNLAASPLEFATLAEALGLVPSLDLAVLDRAAASIRRHGASVAVNASALSIAEPHYAEGVLARVAALPPGRLLLEVTETAEIDDIPRVARILDRIRAAGIPVCLDDFGAGSASLRYLRDLQVDFVKIDGTYVRAASHDEQGRAFVLAMRELATSCGAATIAEMVETEADAALMRELGVQFGQGWLFGRPAPLAGADAPPPPRELRRWRY